MFSAENAIRLQPAEEADCGCGGGCGPCKANYGLGASTLGTSPFGAHGVLPPPELEPYSVLAGGLQLESGLWYKPPHRVLDCWTMGPDGIPMAELLDGAELMGRCSPPAIDPVSGDEIEPGGRSSRIPGISSASWDEISANLEVDDHGWGGDLWLNWRKEDYSITPAQWKELITAAWVLLASNRDLVAFAACGAGYSKYAEITVVRRLALPAKIHLVPMPCSTECPTSLPGRLPDDQCGKMAGFEKESARAKSSLAWMYGTNSWVIETTGTPELFLNPRGMIPTSLAVAAYYGWKGVSWYRSFLAGAIGIAALLVHELLHFANVATGADPVDDLRADYGGIAPAPGQRPLPAVCSPNAMAQNNWLWLAYRRYGRFLSDVECIQDWRKPNRWQGGMALPFADSLFCRAFFNPCMEMGAYGWEPYPPVWNWGDPMEAITVENPADVEEEPPLDCPDATEQCCGEDTWAYHRAGCTSPVLGHDADGCIIYDCSCFDCKDYI